MRKIEYNEIYKSEKKILPSSFIDISIFDVPPPYIVDHSELNQGCEHERSAGTHPDVDGLNRKNIYYTKLLASPNLRQ